MKKLQINFPNGDTYHVSATYVARNRANYYAKLDYENGDVDNLEDAIKAEMKFALSDEYEIIDWAQNNMDWKELAPHAYIVETSFDLHKAYYDAEMSIVELESTTDTDTESE